MRSLVSAWTLVAISGLYALVGIVNKDAARDVLATYVVVAVVLLVTHVVYAKRERGPHA